MISWFAIKSLGLARWVWIGLAALALAAGVAWLGAREQADDKTNQTIGATQAREQSAKATIQNAEKAREAAENVRRDPRVRDAECLRNARNPDDC